MQQQSRTSICHSRWEQPCLIHNAGTKQELTLTTQRDRTAHTILYCTGPTAKRQKNLTCTVLKNVRLPTLREKDKGLQNFLFFLGNASPYLSSQVSEDECPSLSAEGCFSVPGPQLPTLAGPSAQPVGVVSKDLSPSRAQHTALQDPRRGPGPRPQPAWSSTAP